MKLRYDSISDISFCDSSMRRLYDISCLYEFVYMYRCFFIYLSRQADCCSIIADLGGIPEFDRLMNHFSLV